jgi:hypothetical protein
VIDLGDTCHFDPAKLAASVKELVDSHLARERMTTLGRMLVDGMGTTRVVEAATMASTTASSDVVSKLKRPLFVASEMSGFY